MTIPSSLLFGITVLFVMFFIWLCIVSIRVSIAYKSIDIIYKRYIQLIEEKNSVVQELKIISDTTTQGTINFVSMNNTMQQSLRDRIQLPPLPTLRKNLPIIIE